MESSLITTKEVAEIFGKSKNAVNCWHKRGYLPAEKKIDGRLYFSKAFILEVKANYRGNISLAVNGAMNMKNSAQMKLNFSEPYTPQFPTKIITLNDAQKLLGVDEDYLIGKVDNAELSTIDGNFYTEQILQLKFSNDEFAEKNVQGNLFTSAGGIDETLDRIKAENAAQIARIDAIQINSAEWNYLLKAIRDYFDKGNVYLQVPLLDENLRGQLLKILPNDSNYISVNNEVLAWCTKDKQIIETLIQTADKMATPIDENTTEPSTTENAVATPTLETLTAEIQSYFVKMAENIIEIGKRLILAKEMVEHGQWQNWLADNFSLSDRTARNYIAVAERFGGTVCKTENVFRFEPAKLISLLALPAGDEEKFVDTLSTKGTPIEKLSVRKLKKEIQNWKNAAQIDSPADSLNDAAQIIDVEIVDDSEVEFVDVEIVDDDFVDDSQFEMADVDFVDDSGDSKIRNVSEIENVDASDAEIIDVTPNVNSALDDFFNLAEIVLTINSDVLADKIKNLSNTDLAKKINSLELIVERLKINRQ